MPVDTDLTVSPSNFGQQGGFLSNPLGALSTITDIQGKRIQQQNALIEQGVLGQNLQLLQKQMGARAKFGQIMSGAKSMDEGLTAAGQDPDIAPYAGEWIGQYRQGMLSLLQYQGEAAKQAQDGLGVILKGAVAAANQGPDAVVKAVQGATKTLSPIAKERDSDAINSVMQSWTSNLPKNTPENPTATQDALTKNIVHWGISTGILTNEGAQAILGVPAFPTQVQTAPGGGTQVISRPPLGGPISVQGGGAGGAAPPPDPSSLHPDGTPLFAPSSMIPETKLGIDGRPIRSQERQGLVEDQLKKFTEAQPNYDLAAASIGRLEDVKNNITTLAKAEGGKAWLRTGAGGQLRANLGNAVNTLSSIFNPGKPPPIDPTQEAAAESTVKDTINLGFQLVHQMFGGAREAAGTIENGISSVPGLNNTPLGGMLVADLLEAGSKWQVGQRDFKQDWMQRGHDDLTGSDVAYAKLHPPEALVKQIADKYGIGPKGFTSAGAIAAAHDQGLLNDKMAYDNLLKIGAIDQPYYDQVKANGFKPPAKGPPAKGK